jgi:exodeoxyribonuclease VII large subunit
MIRILGHRWPMTKVLLLPVRVQGAEAPPEIAGAIRYANAFHVADLIITGRGGGSIEDLWAFNDERVARAIYASRLPVISAVGHEPDVTISDYVADCRASTPSNAAEIAVPDCREIEELLSAYELRASQGMRKQLNNLRERLDSCASRRVLLDPMTLVDNRRMELDRSRERLAAAEEKILAGKRQRFVAATAKLDAMSPLKVLARGYAMVSDENGKTIMEARDTQPGQNVQITFRDGGVRARVEK